MPQLPSSLYLQVARTAEKQCCKYPAEWEAAVAEVGPMVLSDISNTEVKFESGQPYNRVLSAQVSCPPRNAFIL